MARLTIKVTPDALADLLGELAPDQLRQVLTALATRIEVREWIGLSDPAFHDWLADADLLAPAASCERDVGGPASGLALRASQGGRQAAVKLALLLD